MQSCCGVADARKCAVWLTKADMKIHLLQGVVQAMMKLELHVEMQCCEEQARLLKCDWLELLKHCCSAPLRRQPMLLPRYLLLRRTRQSHHQKLHQPLALRLSEMMLHLVRWSLTVLPMMLCAMQRASMTTDELVELESAATLDVVPRRSDLYQSTAAA